ncbi:patatin-like phospholipase domain-containing protein 4 isoform X1 [Chelonoidis abingdonii]|uniref:patatin-like phospholipase domain-containing protein 4 isoform X1 n=2 Tax=Chelonoidis abingdonii TaxID=106734 RepID=UPI0013F28531|nr:patatin-like phospholipase domain-containing protein 4 isoform X1 [Chelonoidis abingdonii]
MWATKRLCSIQRQWPRLKEDGLHGNIFFKLQQFWTGVLGYCSLRATHVKSTYNVQNEWLIMDMATAVVAEEVKTACGKGPKATYDGRQLMMEAKMKHLNLSFAACGFLGIYHLGAASALCRHGKKLLKVVKAFAGASAGSLVATVLLTMPENIEECEAFTYKFAEEIRRLYFGAVTPGYDFMTRLRAGIESFLPSNAHEIAENRLYVSITNTKNGKNYLVSNFASREDLIKVLLASSFVPVYAGIKAVEYKGEKWIDGGLTNGLPILPEGRTVTVSPFSGRLDICPQDKGHVDLYIKVAKQDLMLSVANLVRLNQALFPPSQKKMELLYQNGFDDAVHFLLKENWFE